MVHHLAGAPWELLARDDVASVMREAFNSTVTSADVIAVSAMEAIGLAEAMEKHHRLATTKRIIPYTNVRGMSNHLNKPPTAVRAVERQGGVRRQGTS